MIFDVVWRLEGDPHQHDLARGWAAELADPVWMLGRQWQMGEHQGEDASSPVRVELRTRATPIEPVDGQSALDPRTVPAETIIESEPGDWWTAGRRVRLGRLVAEAADANGTPLLSDPDLLLAGLPVPYDELNGAGFDARKLWLRRNALGLEEEWFGEPSPPRTEPVDLWDSAELSYSARLRAGSAELVVDRHDGGDLDWFSADATAAVEPAGAVIPRSVTPSRLRYPSAPLPRWWHIEDAAVAVGGHAPDRSSLATLVLIDLIVNQSDDWFTFPVEARTGEVLTLDEVKVLDSFGEPWTLAPPVDWSLFTTEGLDPRSLVVWATTATPLVGPVLDEVIIGIDEDANLVWAVEKVIGGRTMPTPERPPAPPVQQGVGGQDAFAYHAMTPIPLHWHPYVVPDGEVDGRRRFVQGRAADLSGGLFTTQSTNVRTTTDDVAFTAADPLLEIPGSGGPAPDGFFDSGLVAFTTGENAGISREVKGYAAATGKITLSLPMPFAIEPGDAFNIYPVLLPPPASDLLVDPTSGGQPPVHQLEPAAIPQDGLRVERRAILARSTTGEPLLWTQRRRMPMLAPPTFALRFDVLQPVLHQTPSDR